MTAVLQLKTRILGKLEAVLGSGISALGQARVVVSTLPLLLGIHLELVHSKDKIAVLANNLVTVVG